MVKGGKEEEELRKTLEQAKKFDAQAADAARAFPPKIAIERYAAGEFLIYDNRHDPKFSQWPQTHGFYEGKLHEIPRYLIVGIELSTYGSSGPSIEYYSDYVGRYVSGASPAGISIYLAGAPRDDDGIVVRCHRAIADETLDRILHVWKHGKVAKMTTENGMTRAWIGSAVREAARSIPERGGSHPLRRAERDQAPLARAVDGTTNNQGRGGCAG